MTRARRAPPLSLAAAFALPLLILAAAYGRDWHLPGLYMDAINPDYLIPGIVHPPAPLQLIIPGNLLGGRFPVFTGTVYHGSTQLYAALPFMAAFGPSLFVFRSFVLLVGAGILVLALGLAAADTPAPRRVLAVSVAGILALDPAFVLALRTQAYSCMFPLLLLLGCVLLLRGWRRSRRPWLRVGAAGVLYGLAVFSYFVFGFFAPAVLWLLLRNPDGDPQRSLPGTLGVWVAGAVIGYLPFICGILLLRHAVGGTSQLFDWLHANSEQLGAGKDDSGPLDRLDTVYTQSRQVLTGEWPWLMILGHHRTGLLESLKADLLVLLPLAVLLVPGLARREGLRAVRVSLALALSFAVGGLIFGSRLGGHHYTAVLPLLYVAFGAGCAALLPWRPGEGWRALVASRGDALRSAAVVPAIAVVGFTSLFAQLDFHRDLLATGGVKWYTNAIDLFAREVDHTVAGATVYAPDWGYSMPLAFLSTAFPVQTSVDLSQIHREGCAGKAQLVVFDHTGNEAKARLVARLCGSPAERLATWSRRDGVPVFQVAHLGTARSCPLPYPAAERSCGSSPRRRRTPLPRPGEHPHAELVCARPRAHTAWRSSIRPPGGKATLWVRGGASGSSSTGAWAVPGMVFSLRDGVTHRPLGAATVGQAACPVS